MTAYKPHVVIPVNETTAQDIIDATALTTLTKRRVLLTLTGPKRKGPTNPDPVSNAESGTKQKQSKLLTSNELKSKSLKNESQE